MKDFVTILHNYQFTGTKISREHSDDEDTFLILHRK